LYIGVAILVRRGGHAYLYIGVAMHTCTQGWPSLYIGVAILVHRGGHPCTLYIGVAILVHIDRIQLECLRCFLPMSCAPRFPISCVYLICQWFVYTSFANGLCIPHLPMVCVYLVCQWFVYLEKICILGSAQNFSFVNHKCQVKLGLARTTCI
jgi:hypothetical protein